MRVPNAKLNPFLSWCVQLNQLLLVDSDWSSISVLKVWVTKIVKNSKFPSYLLTWKYNSIFWHQQMYQILNAKCMGSNLNIRFDTIEDLPKPVKLNSKDVLWYYVVRCLDFHQTRQLVQFEILMLDLLAFYQYWIQEKHYYQGPCDHMFLE